MTCPRLRGAGAIVILLTTLMSLSCGKDQELTKVSILPKSLSVAGTPTVIYKAIGHYKGSQATQDITSQVVWQASVPSIADFSDSTHPNYLIPTGSGCGNNLGITATAYKDPQNPSGQALFGSASLDVQCATGNGLDFGLSSTPVSVTATAGTTATYTINVLVNSGSPTVTLQFTGGLPAGAATTFNPPLVTGTAFSTVTVSVPKSTATGTYHPRITGSDSSGALTLVMTLIIS